MIDPERRNALASAEFDFSPADMAASLRCHLRWRFLKPTAVIQPLVLAVLAACVLVATAPSAGVGAIVGTMVGMVALVLATRGIFYALAPLLARLAYPRQPNLRLRWQVELSLEGVRALTAEQDAFLAWPNYTGWAQDRQVVLLYQSDYLYQVLPRRALDPGFLTALQRCVAGLPRR